MKTLFVLITVFSSALVTFGQETTDAILPADKYLNRRDIQNSLPRLKRAAESGIAEAQYNYGIYFLEIKLDPTTANQWFEKAAEQGFVDAQFKLAYSYGSGRGVAVDLKKAFYWFLKAAEQGDVQAMFVVAGLYQDGLGTEVNLPKKFEWLTKLAVLPDEKDGSEREVTSARIALAQAYMTGDGVPKDLFKSSVWFLIYNEHKVNLDPKEQDNAILQIGEVEKGLTKEQRKKAIAEAERLLGRKLVSVSKLHFNVFSFPVK